MKKSNLTLSEKWEGFIFGEGYQNGKASTSRGGEFSARGIAKRKKMSLDEFKIELIKQVLETENSTVLNRVVQLLSSRNSGEEFTPVQRKSIEQGLADKEADNVMPSTEVWKKFGR